MSILDPELEAELDSLERRALRRKLRVIDGAHEPRVNVGGRRLLMLSSNNYLGLAAHPALRRAAADAIERYGVGAGASRLIAGSLPRCMNSRPSWRGSRASRRRWCSGPATLRISARSPR